MSTNAITLDALLDKARFKSVGIGSNLVLEFTWEEPLLTLRVTGTSSDTLPDSFTAAVNNLLATLRPPQVAVDLSTCQSLPSVILAFLVYFQKTGEDHGASKVVLYGVNPRIQTVIKMIGMIDFFVIQPDLANTKAWFASLPPRA